jgi:histidine triad (HIT) family protein
VSDPCPFCAIGRDRADEELVAYRSENCFVTPTLLQRPANPGQVIVCPVAHEISLRAPLSPLHVELFSVAQQIAEAAPAAFRAIGTTLMLNQGAPDQTLHHLHLHVIPRFTEDNLRIPNPDRSTAPRGLRLQLASQLREALRMKDAR